MIYEQRKQNGWLGDVMKKILFYYISFRTCFKMAPSLFLIWLTPVSRAFIGMTLVSDSNDTCDAVSMLSKLWKSKLFELLEGLRLWPASNTGVGPGMDEMRLMEQRSGVVSEPVLTGFGAVRNIGRNKQNNWHLKEDIYVYIYNPRTTIQYRIKNRYFLFL